MVLGVDFEMAFKILLGSCVDDSVLERCIIGVPVYEDELSDVHIIVVGELEVEYAISVLVLRKALGELFPCFFLGPDSFYNLLSGMAYDLLALNNKDDVTTFSLAELEVIEFSETLVIGSDIHDSCKLINMILYHLLKSTKLLKRLFSKISF